jgi:hypothetical protein
LIYGDFIPGQREINVHCPSANLHIYALGVVTNVKETVNPLPSDL